MNSTQKSKHGSLDRAIYIAVAAHAGVTDKAGAPYVLHPLRVMLSLESEVAQIVGILHDVVEDAPDWSFNRLRQEGFSDDVIEALQLVTKLPEEEESAGDSEDQKLEKYLRFIRRAVSHPVARAVKLADLNDNLDITRLQNVSVKDMQRLNRYIVARKKLLAADCYF